MAVSAVLWFHLCAAIGWFPTALNLFLPTAIRKNAPEGQHSNLNTYEKKARSICRQLYPPCSFRHLMLPSSGQLMVPTAANSGSMSQHDRLSCLIGRAILLEFFDEASFQS
jgi:hypothetical protein